MATTTEKIKIKLTSDGAQKVKRDLGGIEKQTGSMIKGVIGFAAALQGARKVLDWTVEAGKVQALERAHKNLAKAQGLNAKVMINEMQRATKGTVRELDLLQQANNALLLGLPVTEQDMGLLASAGRRLGKAMGVDAKMGLESLVVGIGRQSKLWLDNLGIIIDTNKAYKDYAISLGKQASALTDAEKKLAFYGATMDSIRGKLGQLGEDTDDVSDSVQRAIVAWEEFTVQLGETAAPAVTRISQSLTNLIKLDFGAQVDLWKEMLGMIQKETDKPFFEYGSDFIDTGKTVNENNIPVVRAVKKVREMQPGIIGNMKAWKEEEKQVTRFTERIAELQQGIPMQLKRSVDLQHSYTIEAQNTAYMISQIGYGLESIIKMKKGGGISLGGLLGVAGGILSFWNPALGAGLTAGGRILGAQHGMNSYVDKPTMIMAGEAGREHVKITPAPINNNNSKSVNINFYGDVYDIDSAAEKIAERSKLGFNRIAVNA